jgi:hypothetical protein
MAENIKRHLSHLKSSGGTAPEATDIVLGEIAVGYKKDSEALYIKNSSEEIVTFSSDGQFYKKSETSGATELNEAFSGINQTIEGNEYVTSTALNYLQLSKLDATAYTPTDLSNYYTKSETSGSTQLTTKFNEKLDASAMTSSEKSGWNDAATKAPMYIYSAITSNINSFTSPIEGTAANINKQAHVLFHNVGSSEVTVTIPTTYKTPKNEAITLTIPVGGYAEVNCLVLASMIFVRAI